MQLAYRDFDIPSGPVRLVFQEGTLVALSIRRGFDDLEKGLARRFGQVTLAPANGKTARTLETFEAYLDGDLAALDRIEADPGGTPFQRKVWDRLRAIPHGTTLSYGALAEAIGDPTAVRAVAGANARNPVAIVIPCHRVIAKDGSLWGYGGGLEMKRWLLTHEGALTKELGTA